MKKENDMGVYIPNMSKPKSCWECFNADCDHWGEHGYNNSADCPLIEIDEPKVGKWEQLHIYRIEDTTIDTLQSTYCPICHRYHTTPYIYSFNHYDYCPNCGSRMFERSE